MAVRIIADSGCDISRRDAQRMDVAVLPLRLYFGDKEYRDGIDMDAEEFYRRLAEPDARPTTSQVPPADYEAEFERAEAAGDGVVCITIGACLSGCFQSASIAAQGHKEIYIVDSENVTIGTRILVEHACRLREQGRSACQIAEALGKVKKRVQIIAMLDTLEYLYRGGRISRAVRVAGGLLGVRPVISINEKGICVVGKARGSKNAHNLLNELVASRGPIDFSMPHFLAYSGMSPDMLIRYRDDNRALYESSGREIPIVQIGSVIGTHAGPGAIAAAFVSKE